MFITLNIEGAYEKVTGNFIADQFNDCHGSE